MAQTSLLHPEGLVQSPAFTHVAVVPPGATTVYIGGQSAVDGDGTLVGGDDVAAQTQQMMKNLHVALALGSRGWWAVCLRGGGGLPRDGAGDRERANAAPLRVNHLGGLSGRVNP